MHFGYPRTITMCKKRNFLKFWVFQGFPHTRLGYFEPIFSQQISKSLQKMSKVWRKIEKKLKNEKNIPNFSRMHFGCLRIITTFQKRNFLKIWVFHDVFYTQNTPFRLISAVKNPGYINLGLFFGIFLNFRHCKIFLRFAHVPKHGRSALVSSKLCLDTFMNI